MNASTGLPRRTVLQAAATLAAAGGAMRAGKATAGDGHTNNPGDFDFLAGEWAIANRRLKDGAWDEFGSEATVWSILGGVGSIEELRIPARDFSGSGIRLLDMERRLWADFWVNAKSGVLTPPPMWGGFANGVGTWISDDVDGETPIKVRGVWDEITPTSCRWRQSVSRDAGASFVDNWIMQWKRV